MFLKTFFLVKAPSDADLFSWKNAEAKLIKSERAAVTANNSEQNVGAEGKRKHPYDLGLSEEESERLHNLCKDDNAKLLQDYQLKTAGIKKLSKDNFIDTYIEIFDKNSNVNVFLETEKGGVKIMIDTMTKKCESLEAINSHLTEQLKEATDRLEKIRSYCLSSRND